MATDRERLHEIIRKEGIVLEQITLSSGKTSPYYYDIKKAIMTPLGLALAGGLGRDMLKEFRAKSVGGLESGAIPFATAISVKSLEGEQPVNLFFVRKEARSHGMRKWIEGNVTPPSVVVDDVVTTGKSSIAAVDRIEQAGGKVVGVIALVDREEGAADLFKSRGIRFVSIFSHSRDFKDHIEQQLQ